MREFDTLTAQALLDAMPSGAVVLDAAGTLIAHNARAVDMLESHVLAVVGKPIEGPFRLIAERAHRMTGGNGSVSFEHAFGNSWYHIAAYPVQAREDGPMMQIIAAADISPQKHAEF